MKEGREMKGINIESGSRDDFVKIVKEIKPFESKWDAFAQMNDVELDIKGYEEVLDLHLYYLKKELEGKLVTDKNYSSTKVNRQSAIRTAWKLANKAIYIAALLTKYERSFPPNRTNEGELI